MDVLSSTDGQIGVVKIDHGPRIPWGVPAGIVEGALREVFPQGIATGRSARTVRSLLTIAMHVAENGDPVPRAEVAGAKQQ